MSPVLRSLLFVCLGCGAAVMADPGAEEREPAAASITATPVTAAVSCSVSGVQRTYVGFAEGMTLDDFELAAFRAEQVLAFLRRELCALAVGVDPSGELHAALQAEQLELFEVLFTQADASSADVGLRSKGAIDPGTLAFRVHVVQSGEGYAITGVERR